MLDIEDLNGQYVKGLLKVKLKGQDVISNEILNVLTTTAYSNDSNGERVFEPTFGGSLWYYLFEPIDNVTAKSIKTVCWIALNKWLPHVQIYGGDIDVIPNADQGYYDITVYWRDLRSNEKGKTNFKAYHAQKLIPVAAD